MKKIYKTFLKIRELNENQKKIELLSAISKRTEKEKELEDLISQKSELYSRFSSDIVEGVPIWYIMEFSSYISVIRDEEKQKEKELSQLKKFEELKRLDYIESKKEKDIAQKLVDKKRIAEIREMVKQEEKFADEHAIVRKTINSEGD